VRERAQRITPQDSTASARVSLNPTRSVRSLPAIKPLTYSWLAEAANAHDSGDRRTAHPELGGRPIGAIPPGNVTGGGSHLNTDAAPRIYVDHRHRLVDTASYGPAPTPTGYVPFRYKLADHPSTVVKCRPTYRSPNEGGPIRTQLRSRPDPAAADQLVPSHLARPFPGTFPSAWLKPPPI